MMKSIGDSPVAWVNNQFVQWVFDVTDIVQAYTGATEAYGAQAPLARAPPNITVSLESAYWFGVNVTSRADARQYPDDNGTVNIRFPTTRISKGLQTHCRSSKFPAIATTFGRSRAITAGTG